MAMIVAKNFVSDDCATAKSTINQRFVCFGFYLFFDVYIRAPMFNDIERGSTK